MPRYLQKEPIYASIIVECRLQLFSLDTNFLIISAMGGDKKTLIYLYVYTGS